MLKIVSIMKLIKHILYIGVILLSSCTTLYELDNKQNNIISVSATPDSLITSIIAPYKVGIDSVMNEILCVSEIEMIKGKPESLLGNFVTDLCLEMYDSIADICVMNNGGLRSSLPSGKITRGDIYKLMPFENELVVLELNAEEVYELAEYITNRGGEPFSGCKRSALITKSEKWKFKDGIWNTDKKSLVNCIRNLSCPDKTQITDEISGKNSTKIKILKCYKKVRNTCESSLGI